MEKQQTAVEWFAEKDTELTIQFLEGKLNQIQLAIEKTKCLQQAKEMEKEQIRQAWENESMNDNYGWHEFYNYKFGDRAGMTDYTISVFDSMYGGEK